MRALLPELFLSVSSGTVSWRDLVSSASLSSSASRPLRLRLRPDLAIRIQNYLGRRYWIIKDPISLRYFRFEEEEYTLLSWLDGRTSLEQLKRRFESQFAPQKITLGEIHQFFGNLYRNSLLLSENRGQGRTLHERGVEKRAMQRRAVLSNFLAIRLRGIDPDRMLGRLTSWFGWAFSVPALMLAVLLAGSAGLLLLVQFEVVQHRLPRFGQFFGAGNWLWLAITLSMTKVLHELGHGVACRRFGGRCHELGVMLLLFMPCLYCNVTDSWMIPSKWRRAAVGAAGMYVELILASIATFLWWFSQPGWLNGICLNVMFVCSVSTLLFNANPLMKYDGYYILSDLLEIPNLRQKASVIVQRWVQQVFLGIEQSEDPFLPHRRRWLFASYAIAAVVYRWVVAVSIFWFLYHLLEPYGLKIVGQMLAVLGLYGLAGQPLIRGVRFMLVPGRMGQVSGWRAGLSGVAVLVLAGVVLSYPLPYYLPSPVVVRPREAETVFVESAGRIVEAAVLPGSEVKRGDVLLRLENRELEQAVTDALGEWQLAETRVSNARNEAQIDVKAWDRVAEYEESAAIKREHYEALLDEAEKLVIRAPRDGVLLAPRERTPVRTIEESDQLPSWSGSVFSEHNRGAYLEAATVVGQVGDPSSLEARLAVEQSLLEFLRREQRVDLLLAQSPGTRYATVISRIAPSKMESVPESLDARYGGPIVTETLQDGRTVPLEAAFEVVCAIPVEEHGIAVGMTGQARIDAGTRSLGQRLVRYLAATFNLKM